MQAAPNGAARWETIPSFLAYEASDKGTIRRKACMVRGSNKFGVFYKAWGGGNELTGYTNPAGYIVISTSVDGRKKNAAVHRMVCEAFHGPAPTDKPMACHRNGIPTDNRPENLYWGDAADNAADEIRLGKTMRGQSHHATPITDSQALWIRENYKAKTKQGSHALALKFGVSRTTIENIVARRTFKYIGERA